MGNSGSPRRSRARHHGLCEKWRLWPNLPPRQLRLRAEWRRQQLGQGALHRGGRAGGQRPRRGEEGGGVVRLLTGTIFSFCYNRTL